MTRGRFAWIKASAIYSISGLVSNNLENLEREREQQILQNTCLILEVRMESLLPNVLGQGLAWELPARCQYGRH